MRRNSKGVVDDTLLIVVFITHHPKARTGLLCGTGERRRGLELLDIDLISIISP